MQEVARGRWQTLEAIRVFALLWIVIVHFAEQIFTGWYIANPSNTWPPLGERIAQLGAVQRPRDLGHSGVAAG